MRVERAIRRILQPVKVNLASLGNQVPHVHWHVIPRYSNDAHFPLPIWAPRQRTVSEAHAVAAPRAGHVAARSGAQRNRTGVRLTRPT